MKWLAFIVLWPQRRYPRRTIGHRRFRGFVRRDLRENSCIKENGSMGRYSKRSISPVLFAPRRVILPLAVLFAFGEWYLLRKFSGRIEYHCEAKPNNITTRRSRIISLRRSRNIIHIAKRESFAKYLFALLSLFSAYSAARLGVCSFSYERAKKRYFRRSAYGT